MEIGGATMSVIDRFRDALAESDAADPRVVAVRVCNDTPDDELRAALCEALLSIAPTMAARERNQIRRSMRDGKGDRPRSSRWKRAAREYNHAFLRERIATSDGMVFLGDATFAQIMENVRRRRSHAAAVAREADWQELLGQKMQEHGVLRPRDLPPAVLDELEAAA